MEIRYPVPPEQVRHMNTDELRANFHVGGLFVRGDINMVYTHIDRVIMGGAVPTDTVLALPTDREALATKFFLERREMGIINVGGPGSVVAGEDTYPMKKQDGLYIGKGVGNVQFKSDSAGDPAHFYFVSTTAHTEYPTTHIPIDDAEPIHLGADANSNKRTIYKYVHPDGAKSCQLTMGLTMLAPNNMWNTMPAHLHDRRMEVYLYCDIEDDNVVFHLMGEPGETRHLVMRNQEAVISPSWSIHSGMGTGNYTFIWAMAGENQDFTDMDSVGMSDLR